MGLYIDSANINDVKKALSWGFLKGVTTNPTILAREKQKPNILLKEISKLNTNIIFAQVDHGSIKSMEEHALRINAISPSKMIIKIPFCSEGIKLVDRLSKKEIKTCLTAVHSVSQGFIGAQAGADFLAVYVGRITRHGGDGVDVVAKISESLYVNDLDSRILAASIPEVEVVENLLRTEDVDITAPLKILEVMLRHDLTDKAIEQFNKTC